MSTLLDLMDAYRDLADHAPTVADLHLATPTTPPARRGTTMRALLATLIAVVAVVALVVYLRSHVFGRHTPQAEVSQPRWPDSCTFGADSLRGYALTRTDMQIQPGTPAASTTYTYTNAKRGTNLQATLTLRPASKLGRYRDGTPVRVNSRHGHYQAGSASPPRSCRRALSLHRVAVYRRRQVPARRRRRWCRRCRARLRGRSTTTAGLYSRSA